MGFFETESFTHFGIAALAAAALGYAVPWMLDKAFLKRLIADRVAGLALGGALVFVLLMGGTTFYLTRTSGIPGSPIVVPPLPFALSFLVGVGAATWLRLTIYARYDQNLDERIVFDEDLDDLSRYDEELNARDERHGHRNWFYRHWVGHLSLPVSYWVNGALISALIAGGAEYLAWRTRTGGGSLRTIAIIVLAYLGVSTLVWIWSSVGIWRSAYWHRRRGGSPGWGLAARVLVVLGVLGTLFRSQDLALQAAEYGRLATGHDSLGAVAEMHVSRGGRELIVDGTLAQGSADRFHALLAAAPAARVVVLTSPGGRILEAERIADEIRRKGLDTRVENACMSACTSILLAGRERSAPEGARIGFHQPTFPGLSAGEQREEAEEARQAYVAAGVEPGFVWRAMTTPPADMWFPSQDELLTAGVLTSSEIVVAHRSPAQKAADAALRSRRLAQELATMAETLNREAPVRLGDITTLTGAKVDGSTLVNAYTLRVPHPGPVRASPSLIASLRRDACANPAVNAAIADGGRIVQAYSDPRGKPLFQVTVSRCQG